MFGPLFPSASHCLVSKDWGREGRGIIYTPEHILAFKTHSNTLPQAQKRITSIITVPSMIQTSLIHFKLEQYQIFRIKKLQQEKKRLVDTALSVFTPSLHVLVDYTGLCNAYMGKKFNQMSQEQPQHCSRLMWNLCLQVRFYLFRAPKRIN